MVGVNHLSLITVRLWASLYYVAAITHCPLLSLIKDNGQLMTTGCLYETTRQVLPDISEVYEPFPTAKFHMERVRGISIYSLHVKCRSISTAENHI